MARPVAEGTIRFRPDTRSLKDVERSVSKTVSRIEQISARGGLLSKAYTQPLGRITGAVGEFEKSLEASNARVIAFGASAGIIYNAGRAIEFAVRNAVQLEHRLAEVNVILNESTAGLKKFGIELFEIAKVTGQTFDGVSNAALEFARQGLAVEETLKRTRDAMILTRLSGLDVQSSVESITATLNTFNSVIIDSTVLVNKLANVDAAFAVSSGDLANAIRRVGSSAQEAGLSLDQLIAMVTTAQQVTARGGAVIGNSLKTIFTRLQRPKVLQDLEAFGVQVKDSGGAMLSTMGVLRNFADAYTGLTPAQRSMTAELVGGVFQVNVLKAAIGDLGSEFSIYDRALTTSVNSTNQAIDRNAQLNQTLKSLINESMANLSKVGAGFADVTISPAIKNVLEGMNSAISSLSERADSDEIGVKMGKGILEGIGNILKGPGLLLLGGLLAKLTQNFFKFSTDAVKTFAGWNEQSSRQAEMQQLIQNLLMKNPELITAAMHSSEGLKNVEVEILKVVRQRNAALEQAITLSTAMTRNLSSSQMAFLNTPGGTEVAAQGFVPNFSKRGETAEIMGAIGGGYMPGDIKKMNMPGMGQITYNSAETVKQFDGMSQPAIMPPQDSDAGRAYREQFKGRLGFDPYSSEGFVPNFRDQRVVRKAGAYSTGMASSRADKVDEFAANIKVIEQSKDRGEFAKEAKVWLDKIMGPKGTKTSARMANLEQFFKKHGPVDPSAQNRLKTNVSRSTPNYRYVSSQLQGVIGEHDALKMTKGGKAQHSNAFFDLQDASGRPMEVRTRIKTRMGDILKKGINQYLTHVAQPPKYLRDGTKQEIELGKSLGKLSVVIPKGAQIAAGGFIPSFAYEGLHDKPMGDMYIGERARSVEKNLSSKTLNKRIGGKTLIRGPEGETLIVGSDLVGKAGSITVGGLSARKIKKANPQFKLMLDSVPNLFDGLAYQVIGGAVGAKFDPQGARGAVAGVKFETEFAEKYGLPPAGAKQGSDFVIAEQLAQQLGTQTNLQLKLSMFERSKRDVKKVVDVASSFSKYLVDMLTNNIKTQGLSKLVGPQRFQAAMNVLRKNPALKKQWSGYFGKKGMASSGFIPNSERYDGSGIPNYAQLRKSTRGIGGQQVFTTGTKKKRKRPTQKSSSLDSISSYRKQKSLGFAPNFGLRNISSAQRIIGVGSRVKFNVGNAGRLGGLTGVVSNVGEMGPPSENLAADMRKRGEVFVRLDNGKIVRARRQNLSAISQLGGMLNNRADEGFVPNFAASSSFAIKQRARLKKMFPNSPLPGESVTGNREGLTRAQRAGISRSDRGGNFDEGWDGRYDGQGNKIKETTGTRFLKGSTGGTEWYHGRIEKPAQAGKLRKIPEMTGVSGFGSYFYDRMASSTKWIQERMMDRGAGLDPADKTKAKAFFEENKRMVGTMYKFKIHDSRGEGGKFGARYSEQGQMLGASVAMVPNPAYQIFQSASVIARPAVSEWKEYEDAIEARSRAADGGKGLGSTHDFGSRPDQHAGTSFELWKKDKKQFKDNWTHPDDGGGSWKHDPTQVGLKNTDGSSLGLIPTFSLQSIQADAKAAGVKRGIAAAVKREKDAGYGSGQVKVGFDSRLKGSGGLGVYNTTEGSLTRAINLHSSQGKSMQDLQRQGASGGRVPNFASGDAMDMTMMVSSLGMMAMTMSGVGDAFKELKGDVSEFDKQIKDATDALQKEIDARTEETEGHRETANQKAGEAADFQSGSDADTISASRSESAAAIKEREMSDLDLAEQKDDRKERKKIAKSVGGGKTYSRMTKAEKKVVDDLMAENTERKKGWRDRKKKLRDEVAALKESARNTREAAEAKNEQAEGARRDAKAARSSAEKSQDKARAAVDQYHEKTTGLEASKKKKRSLSGRLEGFTGKGGALNIAMMAPMMAGMAGSFAGDGQSKAAIEGIGNTAAMAATGVQMGAMLGPVGMAVGGIAAGAIAAKGAVDKYKAAGIHKHVDKMTVASEKLGKTLNEVTSAGQKYMGALEKTKKMMDDPLSANDTAFADARRELGVAMSQIPSEFRANFAAAAGDSEKIKKVFAEITENLTRQKAGLDAAKGVFDLQEKYAGTVGDNSIFVGKGGEKAYGMAGGQMRAAVDRKALAKAMEDGTITSSTDLSGASRKDLEKYFGKDFINAIMMQSKTDIGMYRSMMGEFFEEIKLGADSAKEATEILKVRRLHERKHLAHMKVLNQTLQNYAATVGTVTKTVQESIKTMYELQKASSESDLQSAQAFMQGSMKLATPFLDKGSQEKEKGIQKELGIRMKFLSKEKSIILKAAEKNVNIVTAQYQKAAQAVQKDLEQSTTRSKTTKNEPRVQKSLNMQAALVPIMEKALKIWTNSNGSLRAMKAITNDVKISSRKAGYSLSEATSLSEMMRAQMEQNSSDVSNQLAKIYQQQHKEIAIARVQADYQLRLVKLNQQLAVAGGAQDFLTEGKMGLSGNFDKMLKILDSQIGGHANKDMLKQGRAQFQLLNQLVKGLKMGDLLKGGDSKAFEPLIVGSMAARKRDLDYQLSFAKRMMAIESPEAAAKMGGVDTAEIAFKQISAELKLQELPDDVAKMRENTEILNGLIQAQGADMVANNTQAFVNAGKILGLNNVDANTAHQIVATGTVGKVNVNGFESLRKGLVKQTRLFGIFQGVQVVELTKMMREQGVLTREIFARTQLNKISGDIAAKKKEIELLKTRTSHSNQGLAAFRKKTTAAHTAALTNAERNRLSDGVEATNVLKYGGLSTIDMSNFGSDESRGLFTSQGAGKGLSDALGDMLAVFASGEKFNAETQNAVLRRVELLAGKSGYDKEQIAKMVLMGQTGSFTDAGGTAKTVKSDSRYIEMQKDYSTKWGDEERNAALAFGRSLGSTMMGMLNASFREKFTGNPEDMKRMELLEKEIPRLQSKKDLVAHQMGMVNIGGNVVPVEKLTEKSREAVLAQRESTRVLAEKLDMLRKTDVQALHQIFGVLMKNGQTAERFGVANIANLQQMDQTGLLHATLGAIQGLKGQDPDKIKQQINAIMAPTTSRASLSSPVAGEGSLGWFGLSNKDGKFEVNQESGWAAKWGDQVARGHGRDKRIEGRGLGTNEADSNTMRANLSANYAYARNNNLAHGEAVVYAAARLRQQLTEAKGGQGGMSYEQEGGGGMLGADEEIRNQMAKSAERAIRVFATGMLGGISSTSPVGRWGSNAGEQSTVNAAGFVERNPLFGPKGDASGTLVSGTRADGVVQPVPQGRTGGITPGSALDPTGAVGKTKPAPITKEAGQAVITGGIVASMSGSSDLMGAKGPEALLAATQEFTRNTYNQAGQILRVANNVGQAAAGAQKTSALVAQEFSDKNISSLLNVQDAKKDQLSSGLQYYKDYLDNQKKLENGETGAIKEYEALTEDIIRSGKTAIAITRVVARSVGVNVGEAFNTALLNADKSTAEQIKESIAEIIGKEKSRGEMLETVEAFVESDDAISAMFENGAYADIAKYLDQIVNGSESKDKVVQAKRIADMQEMLSVVTGESADMTAKELEFIKKALRLKLAGKEAAAKQASWIAKINGASQGINNIFKNSILPNTDALKQALNLYAESQALAAQKMMADTAAAFKKAEFKPGFTNDMFGGLQAQMKQAMGSFVLRTDSKSSAAAGLSKIVEEFRIKQIQAVADALKFQPGIDDDDGSSSQAMEVLRKNKHSLHNLINSPEFTQLPEKQKEAVIGALTKFGADFEAKIAKALEGGMFDLLSEQVGNLGTIFEKEGVMFKEYEAAFNSYLDTAMSRDMGGDLTKIAAAIDRFDKNKANAMNNALRNLVGLADKLSTVRLGSGFEKQIEAFTNRRGGWAEMELNEVDPTTGLTKEAMLRELLRKKQDAHNEQLGRMSLLYDRNLVSTEKMTAAIQASTKAAIEAGNYGFKDFGNSLRSGFLYNVQDFQTDLNNMAANFGKDFRSGVAGAFSEAIKGTKTLKQAFSDMMADMADKILDKSIEMAVNSLFNAIMPKGYSKGGEVKGYSSGGIVTGGSGTRDDIPAYLAKGEYVMRKAAVAQHGKSFFDALNSSDVVMAAGGGQIDALKQAQTHERAKRQALNNAGLTQYAFKQQSKRKKKDWMGRETGDYETDTEQGFRLDINKPLTSARIDSLKGIVEKYPDVGAHIDKDIFKKSSIQIGRGGTKFNLKNSFIYDDAKRPEMGKFLTDSRLSVEALRNEDNPQNKYKFEKQSKFFDYQKDRIQFYSDQAKELQQWKDMKSNRRKSTLIGAAAMLVSGGINVAAGMNKGGSAKDNIPALLTGGEYVIRKNMVDKYGLSFFENLNRGSVSGFNKGGYVTPQNGRGQSDAQLISTQRYGDEEGRGSEGGTNNISITVNVDANGNTSEEGGGGLSQDEKGKEMGEKVKTAVIGVIIQEKKPGGLLYE